MSDWLDDIAEGIHAGARVTGIAWLWDRIVNLLYPVVAPGFTPFGAWSRRRAAAMAVDNLRLADKLDQAGLADSAEQLRRLATAQSRRSRGERP